VRKPNGVLTILLKTHHPGVVMHKGKSIFASTWAHYNLKPSDGGRSKAEDVEEEFWVTQLGYFMTIILHDLYHCNTYVCMTCITAIILNYYLFP
jgi:hypothetical protein